MEIVRHPFDYYRFPLAKGEGFFALPAAFWCCPRGGWVLPPWQGNVFLPYAGGAPFLVRNGGKSLGTTGAGRLYGF